MAVLTAHSANLGHMSAVTADGQAPFARDPELQLWIHGRKAAPALGHSSGGRQHNRRWARVRAPLARRLLLACLLVVVLMRQYSVLRPNLNAAWVNTRLAYPVETGLWS